MAEKKAQEYLKQKGFKILATNFRVASGEIDIIAKDKEYVAFVEVKARRSKFIAGVFAVDRDKQQKILDTAQFFIDKNNIKNHQLRFDVVCIYYLTDNWEFDYIPNAFMITD